MEAGAPGQRQLWGGEEVFLFVTSNKGRLTTPVCIQTQGDNTQFKTE